MNEIFNSLGGKRFLLFTGSKDCMFLSPNAIRMSLALNKANVRQLEIIKNSDNSYLLHFYSNDNKYQIKSHVFNSCDLETEFTKITGIYTKFC